MTVAKKDVSLSSQRISSLLSSQTHFLVHSRAVLSYLARSVLYR
jgi:hypothetical protein